MAFLKRNELLLAAKADDLVTIKSFFDAPIDDIPSQNDIKYALKVAIAAESLNTIEYFCLSTTLNQSAISETLISICDMSAKTEKYELISTLCALTTENKPTQIAIDKAFLTFASAGEWDLLKGLCEPGNPPSQEAVGNLIKRAGQKTFSRNNLSSAYAELPFEIFTFMFESSSIKPNYKQVNQTLKFLLRSDLNDLKIWAFISYLCYLKENKPKQSAIDEILIAAVRYKNNALLKTLCLLKEEENPPSKKAIVDLLNHHCSGAVNDSLPIEDIKILCQETVNQPLQADIDFAIGLVVKSSPVKWDYLDYFCNLKTTNKPKQESIDIVLGAARRAGKWDFVKTLAADADNPPSQKAIGELLQLAIPKNRSAMNKNLINTEIPFEILTYLFETSINKPSKEDVDRTLKGILAYNHYNAQNPKLLKEISYLCALTGENKPSQDVMNQALKTALINNKEDLVKQLCLIEGENAPEQSVVGNLLIGCAGLNNRMPVIQLLCETSFNKPTQADVSASVVETIKVSPLKKDYLSYFIHMNTANKPNQDTMDKVLAAAARENDWDFLKFLCGIDNTPSQKAIDNLLKLAGSKIRTPSKNRTQTIELPFDVIIHLFEYSIIKPSKEVVSSTLKDILENRDLKSQQIWEKINYLCALNGDNKPSQDAINKVLSQAVLFNQTDLVKKLCTLEADNAPEQKVIAGTLINSAVNQQIAISLEIIALLCEHSINKPTQTELSAALEAASENKKWAYVSYFSKLETDNKPNQASIDKAVEAAATAGKWELVKTLFSTANFPSQKALGFAMKRAPFEVLESFFETSLIKPETQTVDSTLISLSRAKNLWKDFDKLKNIAYLCALTGENKPSSEIINLTLISAVINSNHAIATQLCLMKSDNAPDQKNIEAALMNATTLDLIQSLCDLPINPPSSEAIDKALLTAVSEQSVEKVQYFCKKELGKDAINRALIEASFCDNFSMEICIEKKALAIVQSLCESHSPDQEAIDEALKAAASADWLELVNYLCGLEKSPNAKAIEEAFLNTVSHRSGIAKNLFEKMNPLSQEKLADTAIKESCNDGMILYLEKYKAEKKEEKARENEDSLSVLKKETPQSLTSVSNLNAGAENKPNSSSPDKSPIKKLDPSRYTSVNRLFESPKSAGGSCFSQGQILAIKMRMVELEQEMGSCFSFFKNTSRKNEKIAGLTELLRISYLPKMTVAEAVTQIENDERFPELRAGRFYNRTGELLDKLLSPPTKSVANCS